jgi:hypothetical protein
MAERRIQQRMTSLAVACMSSLACRVGASLLALLLECRCFHHPHNRLIIKHNIALSYMSTMSSEAKHKCWFHRETKILSYSAT